MEIPAASSIILARKPPKIRTNSAPKIMNGTQKSLLDTTAITMSRAGWVQQWLI